MKIDKYDIIFLYYLIVVIKEVTIMILAAAYLRLSREDRLKEKGDESESIKNQRSLVEHYASEHNWIIYDYYIDENWSRM